MTLAHMLGTIAKTFVHNVVAWLAIGTLLMFGLATQGEESFTRPAVVNANTLAAEHGCANQPNPTHSVVTIDGRTRYVGKRMTDKAIEQEGFGIDHGLTVHVFCA